PVRGAGGARHLVAGQGRVRAASRDVGRGGTDPVPRVRRRGGGRAGEPPTGGGGRSVGPDGADRRAPLRALRAGDRGGAVPARYRDGPGDRTRARRTVPAMRPRPGRLAGGSPTGGPMTHPPHPPPPAGKVLATIERPRGEQLVVSLEVSTVGKRYIRLQLWSTNVNGRRYPIPNKSITIGIDRELGAVIKALLAAQGDHHEPGGPGQPPRPEAIGAPD